MATTTTTTTKKDSNKKPRLDATADNDYYEYTSCECVYVAVFQEEMSPAVILGVFGKLVDANDECLYQAAQLGVTLSGEKQAALREAEPMRWDNPEGLSCWVERHRVRDGCEFTLHRRATMPAGGIDCTAWLRQQQS